MDKKDLRIVFLGTPEFAVSSLKGILDEGYNIVGVITAPDKPSGRGKKMTISAVKQFAIEHGLNLLQPEKLKDELFIRELSKLEANLQVVVAFRMLPEIVWAMPSLGTFNLHASLLPQYRGAAPINHAIINGEKATGLTTFFLDALVDTGELIKQNTIEIGEEEDFGSLHDRMMIAGADLVVETIKLICKGKVKKVPQLTMLAPNEVMHFAPKIFKVNCRINWENSIGSIYNFIRGLSPYPAAFTYFISPLGEELFVKIYKTSMEDAVHNMKCGQLITDGKHQIKVTVSDGYIHILELQMAGKKRMKAADFLRGTPIIADSKVL